MEDKVSKQTIEESSILGESMDGKKMILSNPVIVHHDPSHHHDVLSIKHLNNIDFLVVKGILDELTTNGGYLGCDSIIGHVLGYSNDMLSFYFDGMSNMDNFYNTVGHLLVLDHREERYQLRHCKHKLKLSNNRIVYINSFLHNMDKDMFPCVLNYMKANYVPHENKLMIISTNDIHIDYTIEMIALRISVSNKPFCSKPSFSLPHMWKFNDRECAIRYTHKEVYDHFLERVYEYDGKIDWGNILGDDSDGEDDVDLPLNDKIIVTFDGKLKDFMKDMKKFVRGYNPKIVDCVCQIVSRFGEITIRNVIFKDVSFKISKRCFVKFISKDDPAYSEYKDKVSKEERNKAKLSIGNMVDGMIPCCYKMVNNYL